METSCCNNGIATQSILIFECRMRKRKILQSFLSRQKYENLFQEKVTPILKFLHIKMLMLSGCISDIRLSPSFGGSLTGPYKQQRDFIELAQVAACQGFLLARNMGVLYTFGDLPGQQGVQFW
jgi:hypothetical protein